MMDGERSVSPLGRWAHRVTIAPPSEHTAPLSRPLVPPSSPQDARRGLKNETRAQGGLLRRTQTEGGIGSNGISSRCVSTTNTRSTSPFPQHRQVEFKSSANQLSAIKKREIVSKSFPPTPPSYPSPSSSSTPIPSSSPTAPSPRRGDDNNSSAPGKVNEHYRDNKTKDDLTIDRLPNGRPLKLSSDATTFARQQRLRLRRGSRPAKLIKESVNELSKQNDGSHVSTQSSNQAAKQPAVRPKSWDGRTPVHPVRLSAASIQAANLPAGIFRRRKSLGARSFLSEGDADTLTVNSGYGSLSAASRDGNYSPRNNCGKPRTKSPSPSPSPPLSPKPPPSLTRRRSSFSVIEVSSSRADYLKAFNDSIRKRNARTSSRDRRPSTAGSNFSEPPSTSSATPDEYRRGRLRYRRRSISSAPARGRRGGMMDGAAAATDSWEEFVALGMPRDEVEYLAEKAAMESNQLTPRDIVNITSSPEHERILNEIKYSDNGNYSKGAAFKKSVMFIAGGLKAMNVKGGSGDKPSSTARSSPRSNDSTSSKSPVVDVVIEEDEECAVDYDGYGGTERPTNTIRSRGWKIVKARLTEIAEKAPKNGIDSTPMTFRNLAQLVKAKQFRMMLKRRASFMENGRFQFDEAKQDLYARYRVDPARVKQLTSVPRDRLGLSDR